MSDLNSIIDFITKRDKIIEMLNISIAILFLELSIKEKTIEFALLGEGEKDEIKKFRITSLIESLEEELDLKRRTVFSLVKMFSQNPDLLSNPIKLDGETARIIDNKTMNWFGNKMPLEHCSKAEVNLANVLEFPINPLCIYKHSPRSHIICKLFYDRRYPTTFRFCDKDDCDGCQLAKNPNMRDRKKHFISEDDLEKIIEGIKLYF